MGRPRIKWGQVERFCRKNKGFEIRDGKGGEKVIVGPASSENSGRPVVRIGHTSCRSKKTEILKCYEAQICRAFGITREDLMD